MDKLRQENVGLQSANIGMQYEISQLKAEIERLRKAAEADAKWIGELEFALGNIAHDTIPSSLDADEYALVTLRSPGAPGAEKWT